MEPPADSIEIVSSIVIEPIQAAVTSSSPWFGYAIPLVTVNWAQDIPIADEPIGGFRWWLSCKLESISEFIMRGVERMRGL